MKQLNQVAINSCSLNDKESGTLETCCLKTIDVLHPEIYTLGITYADVSACVSEQ